MGRRTVDKANEYAKGMSKENQEEFNAIYRNLALRHGAPDSKEAQEAIGVWYDYLQNFGAYSLDAFKDSVKCTSLMSASRKISISLVRG